MSSPSTPSQPLSIRPCTTSDLTAITAIYAHYVRNSAATFDLEAPDETAMAEKLAAMQALGHPLIVGESAGRLAGYAYASTYRSRPAYRFTCEDSVYLDPGLTGRGFGSLLLNHLIKDARTFGFRQMLAVITAGTGPSVSLHEKSGFRMIGRHREVGHKFGRWHDVIHMQLGL